MAGAVINIDCLEITTSTATLRYVDAPEDDDIEASVTFDVVALGRGGAPHPGNVRVELVGSLDGLITLLEARVAELRKLRFGEQAS